MGQQPKHLPGCSHPLLGLGLHPPGRLEAGGKASGDVRTMLLAAREPPRQLALSTFHLIQ